MTVEDAERIEMLRWVRFKTACRFYNWSHYAIPLYLSSAGPDTYQWIYQMTADRRTKARTCKAKNVWNCDIGAVVNEQHAADNYILTTQMTMYRKKASLQIITIIVINA